MAIDDPKVIDIVAKAENGELSLIISDHLDWVNSLEHQRVLQIKLNTYLRFVESGEVFEKYPDAKDKPLSVEIFLFEEPDRDGMIFLQRWGKTFREANVLLTHRRSTLAPPN